MTEEIKSELSHILTTLYEAQRGIERVEKLGYKQRNLSWDIHCLIDGILERMKDSESN